MSSDGVLMPEPATLTTDITTGADVATETPTPICACGATERHAVDGHRCARGHALPGNQLHRVHGAYSFRDRGDRAIPADFRTSADDMLAGIIADKGGAENLTTLKREYAQQVRNLRVMLDLIGNYLVRNGLTTPRGRVRTAVNKYPWSAWRVVLAALFGLRLNALDLETFCRLTGRMSVPTC